MMSTFKYVFYATKTPMAPKKQPSLEWHPPPLQYPRTLDFDEAALASTDASNASDANTVNDAFHDDGNNNNDDNNGNQDGRPEEELPAQEEAPVPEEAPVLPAQEEAPVPEEAPVLRRSGRIIARQNNPQISLRRSPRLALKKRVCYKE
jgi:hypothetical protein